MKKIILFSVAMVLVFFVTKEVVATRAHEFIVGCATDEEIEAVLSSPVSEGQKRKQIEIAAKTIECVQIKQSVFERAFSKLMGINLFE